MIRWSGLQSLMFDVVMPVLNFLSRGPPWRVMRHRLQRGAFYFSLVHVRVEAASVCFDWNVPKLLPKIWMGPVDMNRSHETLPSSISRISLDFFSLSSDWLCSEQ